MFKLTNELLLNDKGNSPQQFVLQGKVANALSDFYDKKVKYILAKIPTSGRNPHCLLDRALESWIGRDSFPSFKFREISILETSKIIQSMSNSTALGHDSLDSKGIKDCSVHLAKQINHMINVSLTTGTFAHKWKFTKLSPTLKNKELDPYSVSLYQPIAILPTVSKLVERAAQLQLLSFLESSGQFNGSCHAYRKQFSITTTLMEILDEIHQGAEDKHLTSLMTLDLTAAFDTVSHKLLIEKLARYWIGPAALGWVRNYLSLRTQYVSLGQSSVVYHRGPSSDPSSMQYLSMT